MTTLPLSPGPSETITSVLLREHALLRQQMNELAAWLPHAPSITAVRDRAAQLAEPLEVHSRREDEVLFAVLRQRNESARRLVDLMSLVHEEVRSLFSEVAAASDPIPAMWTILDLTETHFRREESEVFPLAESVLSRESLVDMVKPP